MGTSILSLGVSALFVLHVAIFARSDDKGRQLVFPSFFFFAGKRLLKHNITTVEVHDIDLCELKCYQNPDCVSINFEIMKNSQGRHRCELNNATHRRHDDGQKLQDKEGYFYRGADSACDRFRCNNGGTCQSGFTEKGYRCVCPPGFTSAHCEQVTDECIQKTHNCSDSQVCIKTNESFTCWVSHDKFCYYMANEASRKMDDARQKCKGVSADLPIIRSEEENKFIVRLIQSTQKVWAWLGIKRENGTLFWFDGTPAVDAAYTSWIRGEPNNDNGNEHCAYVNVESTEGTWNDAKCNQPSPGPSVLCKRPCPWPPDPVAWFPLNSSYNTTEIYSRVTPGVAKSVKLSPGPDGRAGGSYEFQGHADSYIEFMNSNGGALDVRFSMTVLLWLQCDDKPGPIFNYAADTNRRQWGVVLRIIQHGKVFVHFRQRNHGGTTKLKATSSLAKGQWAFVGASYDNSSGEAKLWVDGVGIQSENIGTGFELGTQDNARLGTRIGDNNTFKGKIAQLKVYNLALSQKEIEMAQDHI